MSFFEDGYIPGIKNPLKRRTALVMYGAIIALPLIFMTLAGITLALLEGGGWVGVKWFVRGSWKDIFAAFAEGWRGE